MFFLLKRSLCYTE